MCPPPDRPSASDPTQPCPATMAPAVTERLLIDRLLAPLQLSFVLPRSLFNLLLTIRDFVTRRGVRTARKRPFLATPSKHNSIHCRSRERLRTCEGNGDNQHHLFGRALTATNRLHVPYLPGEENVCFSSVKVNIDKASWRLVGGLVGFANEPFLCCHTGQLATQLALLRGRLGIHGRGACSCGSARKM